LLLLQEETIEMNVKKATRTASIMLLVALSTVGAMVQKAKADAENQLTIFTFSGPVEIPGRVLDAGTYVFKVLDVTGQRDVVQVTNKRGDKLYGTFITIPDQRMKPTGKTVITFAERVSGSPEAIKGWFYPGDSYGHEFVYPKSKAVQLAKANNTAVPSMPDEMTPQTAKPASSVKDDSVVALKQTSLKVQKPNEDEVEVADVFEFPPAPSGAPSELPKTASQMPLVGLSGLLLIGVALSLRFTSTKIKSAAH
jgi:hypothetical protein